MLFTALSGIALLTAACATTSSDSTRAGVSYSDYTSRLLVPGQLPAPAGIKSIQLYRKSSSQNPPVIHLGSSQKLVLSFDELSDLSGQFRVTFTHHDAQWNPSNIPQNWYLGGLNELIIGSGSKNRLSAPRYHHYRTEFPNEKLKFKTSGNYMLHVADFSSGIRLFSLPFFVTEEEGEMTAWVETDYNAGPRSEAMERPFSEFKYPEFIEFPQFDLSFYFVQNRFWGDTRKSGNYDFSESDRAQFHLSDEKAFAANYDFLSLNINQFSVNGNQILDYQPDFTPPRILLREDVLNFSADPTPVYQSTFGNPRNNPDAKYASVRFRFEDGGTYSTDEAIYLVGDFNQWLLSESNRLVYNDESGYWETSQLIKQGVYSYRYAMKGNRNTVDDLSLSDTITRQDQEYLSLVYYRDPEYQYHRLLNALIFRSK